MAHRTFLDEHGISWEVWCVVPSVETVVRRELKDGWLAFKSKSETRRLPPCRDDLEELPESTLRELLAIAKSYGKPRRLLE